MQVFFLPLLLSQVQQQFDNEPFSIFQVFAFLFPMNSLIPAFEPFKINAHASFYLTTMLAPSKGNCFIVASF